MPFALLSFIARSTAAATTARGDLSSLELAFALAELAAGLAALVLIRRLRRPPRPARAGEMDLPEAA